jgi:hypothetical protein
MPAFKGMQRGNRAADINHILGLPFQPFSEAERNITGFLRNVHVPRMAAVTAGLPDFSWYNIPKREKYTKLP